MVTLDIDKVTFRDFEDLKVGSTWMGKRGQVRTIKAIYFHGKGVPMIDFTVLSKDNVLILYRGRKLINFLAWVARHANG